MLPLLSLLSIAQAGDDGPIGLRATTGLLVVHNPVAGITVPASEIGLAAQWKGLELDLGLHPFHTIAGADLLYGPELRWSHVWGQGTWAGYSSVGAGAWFGGPVVALPVARGEGGLRWRKEHLTARLGLDLMGSYRAFGVGPRLAIGGSL